MTQKSVAAALCAAIVWLAGCGAKQSPKAQAEGFYRVCLKLAAGGDFGEGRIDAAISALRSAAAGSETWPAPLKDKADEAIRKAEALKEVYERTAKLKPAAGGPTSAAASMEAVEAHMGAGDERVSAAGAFGGALGDFIQSYSQAQ